MSINQNLGPGDVRVRRTPFWLASRHSIAPPHKAVILQPAGLSSVMLATPLLAALSTAFPEARIDWVVQAESAAAIAGNPRLRRLITLHSEADKPSSRETAEIADRLREGAYDTCFMPDRAGGLAALARRAGIPQRIGLASGGLSQGNTFSVQLPATVQHRAARNLALAAAVGVDASTLQAAEAEFYPSDADRTAVTRWLIEDLDWLGDTPLVMFQPGGVDEVIGQPSKRWPAARFARLANYLGRTHGARVILVGGPADRSVAADVAGMMAIPVANQVGHMGLGQVAALSEIAGLFVGNDAGVSHVVAAAGCPTLVIFGPTDPALTAPYTRRAPVEVLWRPQQATEFSWDNGVSVDEAAEVADRLLSV